VHSLLLGTERRIVAVDERPIAGLRPELVTSFGLEGKVVVVRKPL
jgi:hypothetical protein